LAGVAKVGYLTIVFLKEPLSPFAAISALAVIHPVDFFGHDVSSVRGKISFPY